MCSQSSSWHPGYYSACGRYDPDHKESLLCEANTRRSTQTLRNLRLSCNVAGNCELQVRGSVRV